MPKLVFDIETIGEDFDSLDEITQDVLTRWIKQESKNETEYNHSLEILKNGLGFSPLTGEIVTIGVYDIEKKKGTIYYQYLEENIADFEDGDFKYKALSEKEMIEKFWHGASEYSEFISFNGRSFDVPFLLLRGAKYGIKPTKDLMANKYTSYQKSNSLHIDLLDQLSYYGAVKRKGSLHMYCRLFGIKSPKSEGISGDDVTQLFKEKRFKDIAKYNSGDLIATGDLYEYWNNILKTN